MERHWDRIGSLHLKDRKANGGDNYPWGEGDTPIAEVLQLMRDRRASFQATIELEYRVPDDSDPLQEIARCLEFCRQALYA
jgi:sugar phosphate isomerase/epimerase